MRIRSWPALLSLAAVTSLAAAGELAAQSLRGSPRSVSRTHQRATARGLHFYRTSAGVRKAAAAGRFVRLTGNANYRLHNVTHPYVTPTTRTFVQRLSAQYRAACGEPLVVTSAVRPQSRQPANSSPKSVHPTGIAVDLRKPDGRCLTWLRRTLLSLERAGVIEATEERRPPHFHVAVYPSAYERYLARQSGRSSGD